jgi:hemerythrin
MSHLLHYLPFSLVNDEYSLYKVVQYQHDYIFSLLKKLRERVKTHIVSEESLMELRNNKKPDGLTKLVNHNDKHAEILHKLQDIEDEFKTHIQIYDNLHIHKL